MMERKNLISLLSLAGLVLLFAIAIFFTSREQKASGNETPTPGKVRVITLCDEDASGLCVVSFGADNRNQMVINFKLPRIKYPLFYVQVEYGEIRETYPCQVVEAVPTSVYCSGPRTPLGQAIHIKALRVDGDTLLAEGDFVVSAIALPTLPVPETVTLTPEATLIVTATPTPPRLRITPTLPTGYPNN
jgi:hypothetical protein